MGALDRPVGSVVMYGKKSSYDTRGNDLGYSKVSEKERNAYILPTANAFLASEPRTYCGNGQKTPFTVGKYAKSIQELNKLKF